MTRRADDTAEQSERRLRQRRERDGARRAAQDLERRESTLQQIRLPAVRDWHLRLPRREWPGCYRRVLTGVIKFWGPHEIGDPGSPIYR